VTVTDARASPLASEKAALDIGANNLVACTTTAGQQYLYEGRGLFDRFRETTREIARLQSKLEDGRYSSERIRRLYRKRTRRRDHAQEALCRDLVERLYAEGVDTAYIGGLTDVLYCRSWASERPKADSSGRALQKALCAIVDSRTYGRQYRNALVGRNQRQDAQLLGVQAVHRMASV
jgi:transposase